MKNLVKVIMPVGAFILASAGAVGTNAISSKSSTAANTPGYARLDPEEPCQQIASCNNQGNIVCSSFGDQAYKLNAGDCVEVLYHKQP
jgi:hypothetical protein